MRAAILAVLAIGAVSAINTAPAQARDYPFCIGYCRFSTYEQCQATASGRMNYCDVNPYYQGDAAPTPRPRRGQYRNGY